MYFATRSFSVYILSFYRFDEQKLFLENEIRL